MEINTRQSAFGIHLLISVLILVALLGVIFFIWYPNNLIHAGGITGLKILFGVDLVLGPLLTLVVFSPNKKGLAMDLTLIGLLQIACLCAGLWIIYNQRPVLQVIADDGVHIISASDARQYQINLKEIPGKYPKKVVIDLPPETDTWSTIRFTSELVDEKPFSTRQDLYKPLAEVNNEVFDERIKKIRDRSPQSSMPIKAQTTKCAWVPLISIHATGYACVSRNHGVERLSNSFF